MGDRRDNVDVNVNRKTLAQIDKKTKRGQPPEAIGKPHIVAQAHIQICLQAGPFDVLQFGSSRLGPNGDCKSPLLLRRFGLTIRGLLR
jgi:hypothetical protein